MARSTATTLNLPPFSGTTRTLILANLGVYFGLVLLGLLGPAGERLLTGHTALVPSLVVRGEIWQLATYSLINPGILGILFGMLTLWFCGSMLEGAYGGRWVGELYGASVIGAAVIATALTFTHKLGLRPDVGAVGAWAGIFGLLMGIAVRMGEQEFLLWFVVRIRAKYMVGIYILIDLAMLLQKSDSFNVLLHLSGALCGFLYVRYAPRRGLAFGVTEGLFGVRNDYYRWKRRRAARKFEVYMGKQGRKVSFDKDGRYVDPDERKDPNDKTWMN